MDRYGSVARAVVVKRVLESELAVGDGRDRRAREALRVVLQRRHLPGNGALPVALDESQQSLLARAMCRELRVEVAEPLVGSAHVAQQERERFRVAFTSPQEVQRRDDHAFLIQLRPERHRSRRHPADVCVVGAADEVADERLLREHRRDHRDVG